MEMIKISNDKLKVMLTESDMKNYDIDIEKMSYSDFKTRYSIGRILDKAKAECGFDAKSEKMLIQVYPSNKGGCEIFVTALEQYNDEKGNRILRFEKMSDMLRLCFMLENIGYIGQSSAYIGSDNEICYLIIDENYLSYAMEYANLYSEKQFIKKCGEHLVPISEHNAVHTLSEYYVK